MPEHLNQEQGGVSHKVSRNGSTIRWKTGLPSRTKGTQHILRHAQLYLAIVATTTPRRNDTTAQQTHMTTTQTASFSTQARAWNAQICCFGKCILTIAGQGETSRVGHVPTAKLRQRRCLIVFGCLIFRSWTQKNIFAVVLHQRIQEFYQQS